MNWIQLLNPRRTGEDTTHISNDPLRSRFEQDYDRIIFSHPFRSLQDKTQVFPLPRQDFVHTRLTHSLEVASVGRSLGKLAGQEILSNNQALTKAGITAIDFGAIVAAAALMHDIGNPPFGHAGESAISGYFDSHRSDIDVQLKLTPKQWADLTRFEGNAQGFRLVNKPNYQGLKLTFATLGAFSKYPRESDIKDVDKQRKSQKKYGFFQGNKGVFSDLADATGLTRLSKGADLAWCRHPLTFLVEAADDICYNIIDLEDGTNLGLVPFETTKAMLVEILGDKYQPEKLTRIQSLKEKAGLLRALAIQELIQQCVGVFIDREKEFLDGSFDQALTDIIPAADMLSEIGTMSFEKIYKSQPVIEREIAGFEVLHGLLEAFCPPVVQWTTSQKLNWHQSTTFRLLPEELRDELKEVDDLYENLLKLLDFISGLTDSRALALYRNIKGISLPGID